MLQTKAHQKLTWVCTVELNLTEYKSNSLFLNIQYCINIVVVFVCTFGAIEVGTHQGPVPATSPLRLVP